jgi:hypothetical protein
MENQTHLNAVGEITEIWLDVQVSNLGRVKSKDRKNYSGRNNLKGIIRKLTPNDDGYLTVSFRKNGKFDGCVKVHRLVAEAFLDNPENKGTVNHIDGDKTNNHVSNLEWATMSENVKHAIKMGLFNNSGVLNKKSKVTEEQVREIRRLREMNPKKYTFRKLGYLFGISSVNAGFIAKRKNWKHII